MNIEYYCYPCRGRCEPTPEGRCPRCGELAGAVTMETEELPPGQRPERVFGPCQGRIEAIIRKVTEYPFQDKRIRFTPPGERHRKLTKNGRKIMEALREYAEFHQVSTQADDWKEKASALLAGDMISLVLPMLPSMRFAKPEQPSTSSGAREPQAMALVDGDINSVVIPLPPWFRFGEKVDDLDEASVAHWAHELRRLVDREAAEELLGMDSGKETPTPPVTSVEAAEGVILRMIELEFALRSARRRGLLDEEDERAIQAMKAAHGVERDAAQRLGWTEVKLRKRMQRIREKIA
jgi:hypothetical protein